MPSPMNRQLEPAVRVRAQQLDALRQVCERLALNAGAAVPGDLESLDEIVAALATLTENCDSAKTVRKPSAVAEAQEVRAELENLERLKTRFVRNVSHELRTPLASIDGFARALLRMETPEASHSAAVITPETRRQFLTIISQEAQRLGKFIEDVLDLSEIESNRAKQEATHFSARELFADALQALSSEPKTIQVIQRLTPEPDGPLIFADHDALIEVLRQLLSNAHKFSAGQEVVLGAEQVLIGPSGNLAGQNQSPHATTATRLYVRDKGVGIPDEELDKIFQKFYRVERPGFSVPGTGLGLSIVRALVNQNNGQVWAESEVGRGSIFYVLLPDKAQNLP